MIAFEEHHGNPNELAFQGYQEITGHIIFDVKLGENFRVKVLGAKQDMLQMATKPHHQHLSHIVW